ncbi:universal stress protein [Actinoplanes sp. KI2]|uniref:universal stress protein n=1 Tax=Actinoplanes sp. KI2 TaxID=2983315 RepID=UPI0021D5DBFB|nr:universal stress protein [Actinoplanes sp. KI2]MCU7729417.1 universal stress protein [Actinoplanes sp. KI2]
MTSLRVMAGYDGSVAAGAAIDAAAALLPRAQAWITHLWMPPFADDALRRRLWHGTRRVDEFVEAVEREGGAEADRLAATGVTLARAAGWDAEPLVERGYGGEGVQLAELAEKLEPDALVVGSRGLGGARAVLGSVSDMVVHYATQPVLVVPYPMFAAERQALADGPIVVGWDGSPGSRRALAAAGQLFAGRRIMLAAVQDSELPQPAPPGYQEYTVPPAAGLPAGRAVAEALARQGVEHRAAAVVVGSRGRSAIREILLGSVAMATLHHVSRPVLVVPHRAGEGGAMIGADRIEVTTLPARTVVGRRETVAMADLAGFFGRTIPLVAAEFQRHGITPAGPATAVYTNEVHQIFQVTVGFPVDGEPPDIGGLTAEHLPAGRVVRAEHVGPYRTLPSMYAALSAWFADHARVPPSRMWEEYLVGPGTVDESEYRTRVVYPLG